MAGRLVPWDANVIEREAFIDELATNCEIALGAWRSLQAEAPAYSHALDLSGDGAREWRRHSSTVWRHVYEIIGASGRISRVLWGTHGSKRLRRELGVVAASLIRERGVRDALEHLEQRIPAFVEGHPGVLLGGWRISDAPYPARRADFASLRHFEVFRWKLTVYDPAGPRTCELDRLMAEIQTLRRNLPDTPIQVSLSSSTTGAIETQVSRPASPSSSRKTP